MFGFEADFGGIGISRNNTYYGTYDTYWTKEDSAFYADVTGRVGYAAGPALFYVKGGWAYLGTGNNFASNYRQRSVEQRLPRWLDDRRRYRIYVEPVLEHQS